MKEVLFVLLVNKFLSLSMSLTYSVTRFCIVSVKSVSCCVPKK